MTWEEAQRFLDTGDCVEREAWNGCWIVSKDEDSGRLSSWDQERDGDENLFVPTAADLIATDWLLVA